MTRQRHLFKGSTRLHRGWYDKTTRTVELEFHDGARVLYRSVPPATWTDLVNAASAGRFVSDVLERFPYQRR